MIYRRDEGEERKYGFNYGKSRASNKFNSFYLIIPLIGKKAFRVRVHFLRKGTIGYSVGVIGWVN